MAASERAGKSSKPKAPLRKRGQQRVEDLLDSASATFAAKGFDAATMTEIADGAGASIGSLYQFFPTKESLADVLRARYGSAVCAQWDALRESDQGWTGKELARSLFDITSETLKAHPSFAPLMVVRNRAGLNVARVRRHYADALTRLLQSRAPNLPAEQLRAVAIVVQHIIRSEVDLENEPNSRLARAQMEAILACFLNSKMKEASPAAKTART